MERRLSPTSSSGSDDSPHEHRQPKSQTFGYSDHGSPVHEDERRSPRTSTLSPPASAPVSELSYQHYQHYQHYHQRPQHQLHQQSPDMRPQQPRLLPSVYAPSHQQSPLAQTVSTPRLPPISMLTAAASLQPHMQRQTSSSSESQSVQGGGARPTQGGPPAPMHPDDQENLCRYRNKRCGYPRAIKRNGDRHNLCEKHRAKANQNQRKLESKRRTQKKTPPPSVVAAAARAGHEHHLQHQRQDYHQPQYSSSSSAHESLLQREPYPSNRYPSY